MTLFIINLRYFLACNSFVLTKGEWKRKEQVENSFYNFPLSDAYFLETHITENDLPDGLP